jgi:glycosyltransferase involved in cell wall biosynthesis
MDGQTSSPEPEARQASDHPQRISIAAIMPVYNGRLWVEQALASVLAQTVAPDEIIVVDDGCTDDSMELVRAIAHENPGIRIVAQVNAGQSAARNLAISMCASEWIALIDQDDIWYPNHLEVLLDAVRRHHGLPLGWAYSDFDDVDIDGRLVNRGYIGQTKVDNPKRDLLKVLAQGFIIQPSATLIRREAILEVGGFDERLSGYEDDDLFLRIFRADYDNIFIPSPTSQWRIHASSAGGTERSEASLRLYSQKLIEAFPNDKWRGHYYRADMIAPRFIGVWLHMYIRATRFKDRAKMRLYAREASALVRYLRPGSRITIGAALFLLRQPLFIRLWAASTGHLPGRTPVAAWARRTMGL